MKKHLIIHGDCMSGKTLFITTLLAYCKLYQEIYSRDPKTLENNFLTRLGDIRPEILYFSDVNMSISPEEFVPYTTGIIVNTANVEPFEINPKLIIEYSEELKNVPQDGSFTRRFDVINTNSISYKELIQYLNHNKNTDYKCSVCGWNNCHCLNCVSQRKSSGWFKNDLCFDCASITSENTAK